MKKYKSPLKTSPLPVQANRIFYTNLRNNGRSHKDIIYMIQPERRTQFRMDTWLLFAKEHTKPSFLKRSLNLFKQLFGDR